MADEPAWRDPPSPAAIDLVVELTQAQYDALTPKDPNTLYVIIPE